HAQKCPDPNSGEALENSTLQGTLQYHHDLQQWLAIKLESPACGQTQIQLVFSDTNTFRTAETLRGCVITATGKLYDIPAGYYSTAMVVLDPALKPNPSCHPFPLQANPAAAKIPANLTEFHASINVDYRGRPHIDVKVWQDENKQTPLKPWQAYASYLLMGVGEDVIWFSCRTGFHLKDVTQFPRPEDGLMPQSPDTEETVFKDMNGTNVIRFTCEKKPPTQQPATTPSSRESK
ncbi:MAG: hypothetical protein ACRD5K_19975, partial [Candidatus Acidiferrales bacterium]